MIASVVKQYWFICPKFEHCPVFTDVVLAAWIWLNCCRCLFNYREMGLERKHAADCCFFFLMMLVLTSSSLILSSYLLAFMLQAYQPWHKMSSFKCKASTLVLVLWMIWVRTIVRACLLMEEFWVEWEISGIWPFWHYIMVVSVSDSYNWTMEVRSLCTRMWEVEGGPGVRAQSGMWGYCKRAWVKNGGRGRCVMLV